MNRNRKGETNRKASKRSLPLFDIALLFLLVLAIVGGVYWVMHRETVPQTELVYTVRLSGVDNTHSGSFAIGKTLYLSGEAGTPASIGGITHVEINRALEKSFSSDNLQGNPPYSYTQTRSSEKSDLILTVRVSAQKRDGGYFADGVRIAAGTKLSVMVDGYCGVCSVLTVAEAEQQG